jgi:hypothetical protein
LCFSDSPHHCYLRVVALVVLSRRNHPPEPAITPSGLVGPVP